MKLFKSLLFLTIFFSFSIYYLGFSIPRSRAENAIPAPGRIPCTETKDPEFNSSRPYQASPCGDGPTALFCGNKVIVNLGGVSCNYEGNSTCTYSGPNPIQKHVVVDLTDVQLPILGNTQQIKNNQSSESKIDEATRMNEYVSAYLNGTNDQAEYGANDLTKIVDFSGPIKKLLPQNIQEAQRISTIQSALDTTTYTPDPDEGDNPPQSVTEPKNHNQIAVCGKKEFSLPLWITDFFHVGSVGLGKEIPVECYSGGGAQHSGDFYRLGDWNGETKFAHGVAEISKYIPSFLPKNIIGDFLDQALIERWPLKIPPLPWEDATGKPFTTNEAYQKAYSEWRGNLCAYITLPVVGKHLVCIPFSLVAGSDFADLFPYIPLSNTSDKKGKQVVENVHISAPDAELLTSDYAINKSPTLYLAHTQESSDLSVLLKSTFKPKTGTNNDVPSDSTENNSLDLSQCTVLNARSNPGDDATFSNPKSFIDVDTTYSVGEIKCKNVHEVCPPKDKFGNYPSCYMTADCSSDIYAEIPMLSKSPYLNEIWKDTTAGNDSVFRKIYPKVGANAPISCIGDGPGVSKATYAINSDSSAGVSLKGVEVPGGGGGNDSSGNAQLYFPHLGSVYDYFLKGIQTALRPKGYGETIANGQCVNTGPSTGSGKCKQWLFEKDSKGQYYYDKIIAAASAASCNGKSLNPFWAIGIALNENGGLMSDNTKGDSTSHFGCNISQLQTIDEKTSCMINTLRNDCLAGKTDEQTLSEYGYAPGYVLYPITVLDFGGSYPPPLFGSGDTDKLKTNLLNTDWVAVYKSVAPIFCPNSPTLESNK